VIRELRKLAIIIVAAFLPMGGGAYAADDNKVKDIVDEAMIKAGTPPRPSRRKPKVGRLPRSRCRSAC
jgi:hypothetical protein